MGIDPVLAIAIYQKAFDVRKRRLAAQKNKMIRRPVWELMFEAGR